MEPDPPYRMLEEKVKDLSGKFDAMGLTLVQMQITLGRIEERTSGQKETRSEVGATNKLWLGTILTAIGIIVALLALLFKK